MGKARLAAAIGVEAVRAGREVRPVDCAELVEDLRGASPRGMPKNRSEYCAHPKPPVMDELGHLDIDGQGADPTFRLVSTRYEQRSTTITTNIGMGGWAKVSGDEVTAGAIANRACQHCALIRVAEGHAVSRVCKPTRGGKAIKSGESTVARMTMMQSRL